MRSERWLCVVLALGAVGRAEAQEIDWSRPPALTADRPFTPPRATRVALDGGAILLVVENHDLPLVTATFAMVGAGSAADPQGQAGLAGFTADLLDEGAGGLGARELAEQVELLGSSMASWAEGDAAFVSVSSLAKTFPRSLELAAKVLVAPALDEVEAKRVHDDRMTAIQLRRDRPGAVAHVMLMRALHGEHGEYGHTSLGNEANLKIVGLAQARDFYRARYGRDRLVVVIAGDLEVAQARALVEQGLKGWSAVTTAAATPSTGGAPGKRARARLLVVDRPGAEQANVLLGGLGLRRDDPRAFAFDVLINLLGGTFTSRLSHRLREELGYTYGIGAESSYLRTSGTWGIDTAVFTPRTGAALREIFRLLAELGREPVGPDELAASKRNLVRGMPLYFTSNNDIADAFLGLAVNGLADDWFDGYAAKVEAVRSADLTTLARTLLARSAISTVVIGPLEVLRKDLTRLGLGRAEACDSDGEPIR